MDPPKPPQRTQMRQRRSFSLAEKMAIVDRLARGQSATKIAREYEVNESTIRHMRKQEATIRMAAYSMTSKVASGSKRNRNLQMSKMEACLTIWLDDMRAKRLPISPNKVKAKALLLYDLLGRHELYDKIGFAASNGWFERFKKKYELYELRPHDDRAPPSEVEFKTATKTAMSEGQISYDQIFIVENTVFYWKRLPGMHEEAQVTMLFCCNASGNFVTPPVLYSIQTSDPTARSVYVQYDRPGAITAQNVREWFYNFFAPKAEEYLKTSNVSEKAIVLLAHDHNHPQDLVHPSFDVTIMPADCNASCLPTARGILTHFNAVYLKRVSLELQRRMRYGQTLDEAWSSFSLEDATEIIESMTTDLDARALRNGWSYLLDTTEEVHSNDTILSDITNILSSIGLDSVTDQEVSDLITPKEISNEKILEIFYQHQKELEQSNVLIFNEPPTVRQTNDEVLDPEIRNAMVLEINHHLGALKAARQFFEMNDRNKARSEAITKRLKQVDTWMRGMRNELSPPALAIPVDVETIDIKLEPIEFDVEMLGSE